MKFFRNYAPFYIQGGGIITEITVLRAKKWTFPKHLKAKKMLSSNWDLFKYARVLVNSVDIDCRPTVCR